MVDVLVTTAGGIEEDYIKVGAALWRVRRAAVARVTRWQCLLSVMGLEVTWGRWCVAVFGPQQFTKYTSRPTLPHSAQPHHHPACLLVMQCMRPTYI